MARTRTEIEDRAELETRQLLRLVTPTKMRAVEALLCRLVRVCHPDLSERARRFHELAVRFQGNFHFFFEAIKCLMQIGDCSSAKDLGALIIEASPHCVASWNMMLTLPKVKSAEWDWTWSNAILNSPLVANMWKHRIETSDENDARKYAAIGQSLYLKL